MKIGALATATGVSVETLRFYEQEALLTPPQRSRANYRLYGEVHLEEVRFIRNCRNLDIGIEEIRRLLSLRRDGRQSCLGVNQLLDDKLRQVELRLHDLQTLRSELQRLRSLCSAPAEVGDCGIMQGLEESLQLSR